MHSAAVSLLLTLLSLGHCQGPTEKGFKSISIKLHCVLISCTVLSHTVSYQTNYDFQSSYFGPALKSNQLIYSLTLIIHIQHALISSFCLFLFNLSSLLFYLSFRLITQLRMNKSMLLILGWGGECIFI